MSAERRVAKISKRIVDASGPEERQYRVWDTELKGFGLRVTPKSVKTYFIAYRANGGGRNAPQKEFTIGRHGVLTPDQARDRARELLAGVRLGEDPQDKLAKEREDITVAELCDLYLAEGVATKKPGTLRSDKSRINAHIKPLLGAKKQASVTRDDITALLREIAAGKSAKRTKLGFRSVSNIRGGKGAATRTVGLLGGIFTFAIEKKLRTDNPVTGVKRFPDQKSQNYLSDGEIGKLGSALQARVEAGHNPKAIDIITLLLITGCRRTEIEALQRREFDAQRSQLRLGDSKTGYKTVDISTDACAIIARNLKGHNFKYVFPSSKSASGYYQGTPKVWARICEAAGLDDARPHDLRHTFPTPTATVSC